MYNRYIPQPDGTYQRNRIPDRSSPTHHKPPEIPRQEPCSLPMQESCPLPVQESCPPPKQEVRKCKQENRPCRKEQFPQREQEKCPTGVSVGNFLKHLLPKDFDTGDLIIVLLLLLMAGDCAEDQNTALLTLVLYLFM